MWRRGFLAVLTGFSTGLVAVPAVAEPPPQEQSRIERLIRIVEARKDMKFIRNGSEYDCADAAKFLRGKLETMGKEVNTAREFIERIASRSSMSGEPYHVKFADGKTMLASQFLTEELKRLEAS
jgi:hypothetical protein